MSKNTDKTLKNQEYEEMAKQLALLQAAGVKMPALGRLLGKSKQRLQYHADKYEVKVIKK